jgi:hypothetical protein
VAQPSKEAIEGAMSLNNSTREDAISWLTTTTRADIATERKRGIYSNKDSSWWNTYILFRRNIKATDRYQEEQQRIKQPA